MEIKRDIVQEFCNYVMSLINKTKTVKMENTKETMVELFSMRESFSFLSRFENEFDFRNYINISEVFENSIFYEKSYHEDTSEYNDLVQKYSQIKKLHNNQKLFIDGVDDNGGMVRIDTFFTREDRIVHEYKIIRSIEKISIRCIISEQPIQRLSYFKNLPGVIFNEKGFVIPKEFFHDIFDAPDTPACSIPCEVHGNKILMYDEDIEEKTSFFDKRLFKLYNKDGEILNYENIDYYEILYKLRNCIAHDSVRICELEQGQIINIAKLDENLAIVMLNVWYSELLNLNKFEKKSQFRYLDIPKVHDPIKTKDDLENLINNSKVVVIQLDNYGSTVSAFDSLIKKYVSIYNEDFNIKKSKSNYLGNILLKFYDNFNIDIYNLENSEVIKNRLLNDKSFYNIGLDKPKTIKIQNFIIENTAEVLYKDSLVLECKYNANNYLYSTDRISNLLFDYMCAFCEFVQDGKNKKFAKSFGDEVELVVMLSQFLIYSRLIYGNFYDKLKLIKLDDIVDLKYYESKEGELRLEINKLDMNKFMILDSKKSTNSHKVESFRDKILALRLLRNSVAHGNFYYQLSKNVEPLETLLILSSRENENIKINVKVKDLINLLNNDLFVKYTYKAKSTKIELYMSEVAEFMNKLLVKDY